MSFTSSYISMCSMADQKVSQTEAVQVKTEEIKQETPAEGEAKVVVKSQPTGRIVNCK